MENFKHSDNTLDFLRFILAAATALPLFLCGGSQGPINIAYASSGGDAAGKILLVKGQVFIVDATGKVVADPEGKRGRSTQGGSPFYAGETVQTKGDGRVKLQFVEGNNEVVLGANTALLIERAGTDAAHPGTSLNLARGEVRATVNQKYSGQGEDSFELKTKNAVAGVRGTILGAMTDFKATPQSPPSTVIYNDSPKNDGQTHNVVVTGSDGKKIVAPPGTVMTASTSGLGKPMPLANSPVFAKVMALKTGNTKDSAAPASTNGSGANNGNSNGASSSPGKGANAPSAPNAPTGAPSASAAGATQSTATASASDDNAPPPPLSRDNTADRSPASQGSGSTNAATTLTVMGESPGSNAGSGLSAAVTPTSSLANTLQTTQQATTQAISTATTQKNTTTNGNVANVGFTFK